MLTKDKESKLVQTRISDKLNKWLAKAAEAEGISVAAFIRRLIMRAHTFDATLDSAKNQASK